MNLMPKWLYFYELSGTKFSFSYVHKGEVKIRIYGD